MFIRILRKAILTIFAVALPGTAAPAQSSYATWANGINPSDKFFPIAVWLQDPRNAARFQAAGINTYVGLWQGPTDKQLADLKQAGMRVICDQNAVALKHLDDQMIVGWMHGDEPDNAQERADQKGYGPPIAPAKIIADYQRMKAADPTRPVMLNLGQGVAWDGWYGRGVRTNHPEDYAEYLKGCDIASFDIYPAVHDRIEIAGKLWYVPLGVDRLRKWSDDRKIVWNCIECTRISNTKTKPTPKQVEAEVWMSLIHGSQGLIYFVHQFQPSFVEAALLQDAEMLDAVTKINRQIQTLAPVLNAPSIAGAKAASSNADVPVDVMVKRYEGAMYIFAVAMRDGQTTAKITIPSVATGVTGTAAVQVIGEDRQMDCANGTFADEFAGYAVHLYRIAGSK